MALTAHSLVPSMAGSSEMEILLRVALLLVAAKVGGEVARRLRQPAVAGEILAGILIGPSLFGWIPAPSDGSLLPSSLDALHGLNSDAVLGVLAELGVLLLLFQVGLESSLKEFKRVGGSAALVGTYGVLFSVVAGYGASWLLARSFDWAETPVAASQPWLLHLFVGATLAATSVGITARVLRELGVLASPESRIILGAAVFDDVLGLIILGVVSGLVQDPGSVGGVAIAKVAGIAVLFLVVALAAGAWLVPRIFEAVTRLVPGPAALLGIGLAFMIALSAAAGLAGLAPIVGAFAAGLALSGSKHNHELFEQTQPVAGLFVGLFFVLLGVRVDVGQLTGPAGPLALAVGVALTVLAVGSKLLAGFGVMGKQADRLAVGVGMVPRGEVGLIFALFGLEHGLVGQPQYAAIVFVVLATTLVTPPWLKGISGRFHAVREVPDLTASDLSHTRP